VPQKLDISEVDLANAVWHSAGSLDAANRVEVAAVGGGMAMRDSDHPEGPVLLFTKAEWDAFVAGARAHEFDPPGSTAAVSPAPAPPAG
jgi:Domain of unknown function (DUF397)